MSVRFLTVTPAALLVLVGGTLGTLGRHGAASWWPDVGVWPWPTFTANIVGSLLLGLLAARVGPSAPRRLLLGTGVLGGFTTYSAFAVETDQLLRSGHLALAMLYPTATVALGLLAALAGLLLGRARPDGTSTA